MNNTYYTYDLENIDKTAFKKLQTEISSLGFKRTYPELGAGIEPITQIISYFTIHQTEIVNNLISDTTLAIIYSLSKKLYSWYKNIDKSGSTNPQIVVNVDVHIQNISKVKSINLNLGKDYSEDEIIEKLSRSELVDIIDGLYDYEEENDPL